MRLTSTPLLSYGAPSVRSMATTKISAVSIPPVKYIAVYKRQIHLYAQLRVVCRQSPVPMKSLGALGTTLALTNYAIETAQPDKESNFK